MKTLNLELMGVQEMDAREVKETDGGCVILAAIMGAAATIVVAGVVADWPDFKQGLIDGYNGN